MELYLFRHGIAADREDTSVADPDRPLTEEGTRKTRGAAEGLRRLEISFDAILASPWLRASQTADVLSEVLGIDVEQLPELAGDRDVKDLLEALSKRQDQRILLVGHQPMLGETAAHLLCHPGTFEIDFKKSGVCAVEVDELPSPSSATLLWLLTSKQLRMIGRER